MEYRWAGQKGGWSCSYNCPQHKPNVRLSSTEIPSKLQSINTVKTY